MKLLCASRRPGIVIKFWRQIVRDADPGHDVTKSRRRERSRRFVSSLISFYCDELDQDQDKSSRCSIPANSHALGVSLTPAS